MTRITGRQVRHIIDIAKNGRVSDAEKRRIASERQGLTVHMIKKVITAHNQSRPPLGILRKAATERLIVECMRKQWARRYKRCPRNAGKRARPKQHVKVPEVRKAFLNSSQFSHRLMNVPSDKTIGRIMKKYCDKNGVPYPLERCRGMGADTSALKNKGY